MTTYRLNHKGQRVGTVNTNPDGFVIIDADDLRAYFIEAKRLWDSPVTVTPFKNILRVRLDISFKDVAELEDNVRVLLEKKGYEMVPAE